MALEGSLVLPLFLFFIITVLLSLEAVRFQSDVQEAMHQTGNQYTFAGYLVKYADEPLPDVQSQIKDYLGSQLHPYLCVAGGESGVQIQDLSTVNEDGRVEFIAEYQLKPFASWIPIGNIVIRDRFLGHAFTGYTGLETQGDRQQEIYVYITKTGSKYHLSYDCNYLKVQVQAVDYESVFSLRNRSGEKYHACLRCKPQKDGVVYITADGNRYHGQSDCSSLKRMVYMIPLSEADGYGACSKCAG
ncbi:MAG: hypothetical protein HDQ97_09725 [Lachnospiraceae bacterium]|nr:hypothetical protein [Lachnospiraceae bacterium]